MGLFSRSNKKKNEISPGGSTIVVHEDIDDEKWTPPVAHGKFAKEAEKRFEELFPGRESIVRHEIASDLVHIDVNIMKPTEKDNFYVIYTTGMSDLPMSVSKEIKNKKDLKYAELYMFLPESWDPGELWPVKLITELARFPHKHKTWLGWGHTIPNGADYQPIIKGSKMSGVLLDENENVGPVAVKGGAKLRFYMVVPVSRAETAYKLKYGTDALKQKFAKKNMPLAVDIYRKSIV